MASYWEGMWGVVQATVSELDFDFRGYAEEHLGARTGRGAAGGRPCRLSSRRGRSV